MTRIGLIGTDNSHVDHLLRAFNVESRYAGLTITTIAGDDPVRNAELAGSFGVEDAGADEASLLDRVDAIVVTHRDGARHAASAIPFLAAGMPTYIDKPLATTVADAERLVELAESSGAPLLSCSPLHFAPAVEDAAERLSTIGEIRAVHAIGPGQWDGPYGGTLFYGIHPVDVALRFASGAVEDVRALRHSDTVTMTATVGGLPVSVTMVGAEQGQGRTGFQVTLIGTEGIVTAPIALGPHYLQGTMDAVARMVDSRRSPLSLRDMIRPIVYLTAVQAQL